MGGLEDEEPALKRMKVSLGELRGLSNGSSVIEPAIGLSRDSMARPLRPEGDDEVVGSIGVIKKIEFVRIIANALYSLGYKTSGARLEEESGIPLHSSAVSLFMQQILDGLWDQSIITLQKIGLSDDSIVKSASFLILEQKFFELLEEEKVLDALMTLRTEISPLGIKNGRMRELSTFIVSPSLKTVVGSPSPSQNIVRVKSRSKLLEELQKLLPPSIMIPERRLEHLVEQALLLQLDACTFHNSSKKEMSLYTDHDCGKNQIPCHTTQILHAHDNEIWFLQFSHNGRYLASASSDQSAIIWEVCSTGEVTLKHRLCGHQKPVSSLSWSPNDHHLLTCGLEEAIRLWDVSTGKCLHVYEKTGLGLVNCGWFPDGKVIVSGVSDKSICMWGIDGKELECWKGQRTLKISDIEVTKDGKQIISIGREKAILLLDRETKIEKWIVEDKTVTSFQLSNDSKFLLVNLMDQEIHLWNIEGEMELVAKYKGHKRTRFVIRSCFGGIEQSFLASGSEDSQVYIWHRESRELIKALSGHSGSVNCVSWNPANPHMLASGSDDRTIRIWGLHELNAKRKHPRSNGSVQYCNGGRS